MADNKEGQETLNPIEDGGEDGGEGGGPKAPKVRKSGKLMSALKAAKKPFLYVLAAGAIAGASVVAGRGCDSCGSGTSGGVDAVATDVLDTAVTETDAGKPVPTEVDKAYQSIENSKKAVDQAKKEVGEAKKEIDKTRKETQQFINDLRKAVQ